MELREVQFKREILNKEKQLLIQFAEHISKIHSVKVANIIMIILCVSVFVRTFLLA